MLARIGRAITATVDLGDLAGLAGLASLFYGLHCWWPPASFIVLGVVLIAAAVAPSLRGGGR